MAEDGMNGWSGTVLRVDLSEEKAEKEPLDEEIAENYIGGRGLNIKTLFEEVKPGIDPLSPENVLCLSVGPFTGTPLSQTSRMEVSTLSPYSGILGDGNSGGDFPNELKLAGYDQIVITGKADSPKYLWIEDDEVELRDAEGLWRKNTWETTNVLKEKHGENVKVACIGPAGENLVRVATTMNDKYYSAARGSGAVWGSKNLKAIALKGTGEVDLADPDKFMELANKDRQFFINDEFQQEVVAEIGTHVGMIEWGPRYRWEEKELTPEDLPEEITPKGMKEHETGRTACHGCVVQGKDVFEIPSGEYEGEKGVGMEYEHMYCLGTNCGIMEVEPMMIMENLCDKNGMCTLGLGNMVAFVKDLYNRGIIDEEDTEGLSLEWEDAETQIELVKKTAKREGFGNVVAEGLYGIGKILGEEAMDYCYHVKGLSRGIAAPGNFALSHATSTRGADHLRGRSWTYSWIYPEKFEELQEEGLIPKRIPALVKHGQTAALIPDMTGRCKSGVNNLPSAVPLAFEDPVWSGAAKLLTAATGIDYDEDKLEEVAERVYNLERAFNVRQGVTKKQDRIPQKPSKRDHRDGIVEREEHEEMLEEYYELRGWDKDTGVPKRKTLEKLGLKFAADELKEKGPFSDWDGPPLRNLDEYPTGF